MKKLFLILVFIFGTTHCFAQDSVYVEGYSIKRFLEKEISFKLKNDILKEQGKSYSTMIDYTVRPYYFTLRVNSKTELTEGELNNIFLIVGAIYDYKNLEVYKFNRNIDFPTNRPYYKNPQNSDYVYHISYIKGYAVRKIVNNDCLNEFRNIDLAINWNIDPYFINWKIPYFYLYEFYKIDEIDVFSPPPGFELWEPNINVKELN